MVKIVFLASLSAFVAFSSPGLAAQATPAQTVLEVAQIDSKDNSAGNGFGSDKTLLPRLFSKSFNADYDRAWSHEGNWWDADFLTGQQGTGGMTITKVIGTKFEGDDKAFVTVQYHEWDSGSFRPLTKAAFILLKEDGLWKVDEVATAGMVEGGGDALHAYWRHLQQGFWQCGQKQCSNPDWVIKKFEHDNAKCRSDTDVGETCNEKDAAATLLRAHDYCYGKKGEEPYDMRWQECNPKPVRE